jgi:hypothetical protein
MPEFPDATFENCTIVGPDNAVQVGYPGFQKHTRLKFKDCRLIVTNFSQPRGTPATGVVSCDLEGKYLHIDFEDCTLMGYKLFGSSTGKINKVDANVKEPFTYTTKGKCRAYVEFEQAVPDGFERLGRWPVEVFEEIIPCRFHGKNLKK